MVAQAVVEEIALPTHAVFCGNELLPVLDDCCHSRFARERNHRMQMIRHKQTQAAMPDESLVIEFHGSEHSIAGVRTAQLVFARRDAIDGNKEPTALGYPLRNCVRQLFANGQIHARSVAIPSYGAKRKR